MSLDRDDAATVLVFDWLDQPVGSVEEWVRCERTGEPRALNVLLDADTRSSIAGGQQTIRLPADWILAMRRDRIVLDRPLSELARLAAQTEPEETQLQSALPG